jgi:hypothetical protein
VAPMVPAPRGAATGLVVIIAALTRTPEAALRPEGAPVASELPRAEDGR